MKGVERVDLKSPLRVSGRLKREETYVYLRLIYIVIWQKPTQYFKAIILQLKINFLKSPLIISKNNFLTLKGDRCY